jgi:hypothetical protein
MIDAKPHKAQAFAIPLQFHCSTTALIRMQAACFDNVFAAKSSVTEEMPRGAQTPRGIAI